MIDIKKNSKLYNIILKTIYLYIDIYIHEDH